MSGSVCPACGVAVVPGYVRCPKCHRPLPRTSRNSISPVGGTTLETSRPSSPIVPIVVVIALAGGAIAYFATRGKHAEPTAPAATSVGQTASAAPAPASTSGTAVAPPTATAAPAAPHPDAIAAQLERSLKKQQLWSTVAVVGDHVDVRSGSCNDPGMKASLEATMGSFKAAGLTKIRCLEESGVVVFNRDL